MEPMVKSVDRDRAHPAPTAGLAQAGWLAPVSGISAAVLTIAGLAAAGSTPVPATSATQVLTFYRTHANAQLLSGTLQSLGALAFLLFAAILFVRLREASDARIASLFSLGGAVLLATGLALFAGISITLGDAIGAISGSAAQAINAASLVAVFPATIGISAFLLGAGAATVRSDLLPAWLAWTAIALGAVAVVPSHVLGGVLDHIGFVPFVGVFIWTAIAGLMLARRAPDRLDGPESSSRI